ncbi:MAG: SDR family NAD(P)-dependent oxidoreductase [Bdellovibrio sp.]
MKKILITGGAGFIGSRLAKALTNNGYEVVVMDNLSAQIHGAFPTSFPEGLSGSVTFLRGDVSKLEDWERALVGVDAVAHLAAETGTAQSMYQISHYNKINSQGTALLFEALSRNKGQVKRIVLASSRSIYGEGAYSCDCNKARGSHIYPQTRTIDDLQKKQWEPRCPYCHKPAMPVATPEDARISPASIYAATKYAQEDLVRIGCSAIGISSVILRFQNVYGEGQSLNNPYTGILSIFSTRIRRNLSLPIFEDGKESRDFVHVSDVVNALTKALIADVPNGSVYNVGSGKPSSVIEVANLLVAKFKGKTAPHITGEFRIGDIRHCYADLTLIKKDLDFQTQVSLSDGLDRFANWVQSESLPEDGLDKANQELRARGLMK